MLYQLSYLPEDATNGIGDGTLLPSAAAAEDVRVSSSSIQDSDRSLLDLRMPRRGSTVIGRFSALVLLEFTADHFSFPSTELVELLTNSTPGSQNAFSNVPTSLATSRF